MKRILVWLPLTLSLLLFLLVGVTTNGFNLPNPFQLEIVFSFPQLAASRAEGGIFVIDNAFRRVIGLTADQVVDVYLEGGSKQEGRFFYAHDLTTDKNGNLFLLNYVHDEYGMFLVREEILHYDHHGRLQSIIVQRYYDEMVSTRIQRGEIWAIRSDGEWLSWLLVTHTGVEAFRISIERQVLERLGRVRFDHANRSIADLDWISNNELILNLKNGTFVTANLRTGLVSDPFYRASGFPSDVPWEIIWTNQGFAYVNLIGREIRLLPHGGLANPRIILDPIILQAQGFPSDPYYYYRLNSGIDGLLLTTNDEAVIKFDTQGTVLTYKTQGRFNTLTIATRFLFWIGLLTGIILFIVSVRNFYVLEMNRKVSILLKQILILVPMLVISMILITSFITRSFLERAIEQESLTIAGLTQAISRKIDGDLMLPLTELSRTESIYFEELRTKLHESLNDNQDPWNRSYYFALYKVLDDVLYGMMYQNDRIGMFFPFSWFDEEQGVYRLAQAGSIATEKISDVSGEWLYSVGPIRASDGTVVGLLEIGTDLFILNKSNQALFDQTMQVMGLISVIIVLIIILMNAVILKSISIVKRGVGQISQGNWDYQINVKSNDEMSDLGQSFNIMSQSIGQYLQEIKKLNSSYRRFFPEQFLTYLDIPSMTDARLGDQVQKTMTVYFSDIRSFTSFSEKMTPKENFDFLNSYLNLAGPIIRKNNGFIDKYMGDAIMALFPIRPDDAVSASTEIHQALLDFNRIQKQKGQIEIAIGIGIHTGPLMLGILGESERMQGTVISDSVNLASRLESLTKQLGASTLVSEETLTAMAYPDMISTRYVGKVRVKGKQQAMKIYEVLEGLSNDLKERKIQLKPRLSALIRAYESGNIAELEKHLKNYPIQPDKEPILKVIISTMESWKTQGVPQPWDGTITFDNK